VTAPRVFDKIGLAVFKDHQIMMARTRGKKTWAFVGGKVEAGESDADCLIREIREETGCDLDPTSIKLLGSFAAPAHGHENTTVQLRLYTGNFKGQPKPSSEIEELGWFDSAGNPQLHTPLTNDHVFPWLKQHGLIR